MVAVLQPGLTRSSLHEVVSLHYADNCGGPFTSRLREVNQPVIGPRIKFSGPLSILLTAFFTGHFC